MSWYTAQLIPSEDGGGGESIPLTGGDPQARASPEPAGATRRNESAIAIYLEVVLIVTYRLRGAWLDVIVLSGVQVTGFDARLLTARWQARFRSGAKKR
jgi:hypothetical protein